LPHSKTERRLSEKLTAGIWFETWQVNTTTGFLKLVKDSIH